MNFFAAGIILLEVAGIVGFFAAVEKRGYTKGQKAGYDEGFQAGHKAADDWWLNWEHEVTKTRETIKHESGNQEGWP
jgi:flagellar biosynthesis/type III secretory pathway protein FliH